MTGAILRVKCDIKKIYLRHHADMATNKSMVKDEPVPRTAEQSERSKLNLSSIKFGMDAEIEKALSLYGKDELHLSKVYWPKAFRWLSTNILESLLKKPEIWNEVCTPNFVVDGEQLQRLIDELKFPTSPYIKVKHRR